MITYTSYTELMDADLIAALKSLANIDAPYPEALLAKRRAWFLAMLDTPLEARLAAIDARLGETNDLETVNNLLEEKAEILIELEKG
jgi:hypothetical protein